MCARPRLLFCRLWASASSAELNNWRCFCTRCTALLTEAASVASSVLASHDAGADDLKSGAGCPAPRRRTRTGLPEGLEPSLSLLVLYGAVGRTRGCLRRFCLRRCGFAPPTCTSCCCSVAVHAGSGFPSCCFSPFAFSLPSFLSSSRLAFRSPTSSPSAPTCASLVSFVCIVNWISSPFPSFSSSSPSSLCHCCCCCCKFRRCSDGGDSSRQHERWSCGTYESVDTLC